MRRWSERDLNRFGLPWQRFRFSGWGPDGLSGQQTTWYSPEILEGEAEKSPAIRRAVPEGSGLKRYYSIAKGVYAWGLQRRLAEHGLAPRVNSRLLLFPDGLSIGYACDAVEPLRARSSYFYEPAYGVQRARTEARLWWLLGVAHHEGLTVPHSDGRLRLTCAPEIQALADPRNYGFTRQGGVLLIDCGPRTLRGRFLEEDAA